jgi:hypothetical protein
MRNWIVYGLIVLGAYSCTNPVEKVTNQLTISITEAKYNHTDSAHHYHIEQTCPVVDANFAPDILNNINNTIPQKFHEFSKTQEFIDSHTSLPKGIFNSESEWMGFLTNSFEVNQADSLLFISLSFYQYFIGAAHGVTTHHSLRFNLTNGELIPTVDLIKTDSESLQEIKQLVNSNLPDSVCWGIQNDTSILSTISNFSIVKDSVIFYIDDYSLCPYAFGEPSMRFSNTQLKNVLKVSEFKTFNELQPVVDEGEIATH